MHLLKIKCIMGRMIGSIMCCVIMGCMIDGCLTYSVY